MLALNGKEREWEWGGMERVGMVEELWKRMEIEMGDSRGRMVRI